MCYLSHTSYMYVYVYHFCEIVDIICQESYKREHLYNPKFSSLSTNVEYGGYSISDNLLIRYFLRFTTSVGICRFHCTSVCESFDSFRYIVFVIKPRKGKKIVF